jgi:hypothetical protein
MATSKLNSAAVVSNALGDAAKAIGTLNVYTFPTSVFTISHGITTDGKRAKVILEPAIQDDSVGTIQIFAPYGQDEAMLAEFVQGAVIDGSKAQDLGYYFKHSNGSNYQWLSESTAIALMTSTGLNSSVMAFPEANKKLTREQARLAKNINLGNTGNVAVTTKGGTDTWLATNAKAAAQMAKNLFS